MDEWRIRHLERIWAFAAHVRIFFTMFVVALVIVNKYTVYVQWLVTIENLRKLRKK